MKRDKMTPFGEKAAKWCIKQNMTKKELAELAGVSYGALLEVGRGRRPGRQLIPRVEAAMHEHDGARKSAAR